MGTDPIPEDIRQYLRAHFDDVRDEPPEGPNGDYYVFSMKLPSGQFRKLKVHRENFVFSNLIPDYLQANDLAAQLGRADAEIVKPITAST